MEARTAVGYLRRSSADAGSPGDISREVQEQAIADLAHRDGHDGEVRRFTDWDRSADEGKSKRRTAYAEMLVLIESGQVSTVYAYSLDRLNRSLVMSARFAMACEAQDVRIVTLREGEVRQDTPAEWLRWTTLTTFGEFELRTIKARSQGAVRQRRARGDHMGAVPYGQRLEGGQLVDDPTRDVQVVVDAFRKAGSYNGAAKALNLARVPTRNGASRLWWGSSVRTIIARVAPALVPPSPRRGARTISTNLLSGLLRCSCGSTLTPKRQKGRSGVSYQCYRATRDPRHPRPGSVPEAFLLPWVMAEAARLRVPSAVEVDADDTRRDVLAAKRDKYVELFASDRIDSATFDAKVQPIDEELAALAPADRIVEVPTIEWETDEPGGLNAVLRSMWSAIVLDQQMRPVEALWWDRRLRAD